MMIEKMVSTPLYCIRDEFEGGVGRMHRMWLGLGGYYYGC